MRDNPGGNQDGPVPSGLRRGLIAVGAVILLVALVVAILSK